ncbi:MAG: c-type cytochrome biogenesis protein CcmI [Rhodobiaceae bacterium]|nr:c-type cytochrome biogenesis protein CcmI [Rhodobiaceae bacterium]MCC0054665.1 c-type cytochrome biogenesis protein CcmI [Rhodobiaceae bacterium]
MIFFIAAAILTGAVILFMLRAVSAKPGDETGQSPAMDVYKAQMGELDRDAAAGLIPPADAEAARIELSRRLLAESRKDGSAAASRSSRVPRPGIIIPIIVLPFAAIGLYAWLGTPGMPDMPLGERMSSALQNQDVEILMAQVEKHLAENPNDLRGWTVIAPVYLRRERYNDAVLAFSNVNRLGEPSAASETGLGEALVGAQEGVISDEARAAFQRALKLEPGFIRARFFLAIAADQDGDREEAVRRWKDLLASSEEPDGGWRRIARQRLAALQPETQVGPGGAEIDAASQMAPEDRQAMIRSMVAGLAERLKENPDDQDGWIRLIRSYTVLGDREAAARALGDARAAFAGDPETLGKIVAAADALGVAAQ